MALLRRLVKYFPTLLLSFALALAVWISAVTASDPTVEQVYPDPVKIEVVGQDPGLIVVSEIPAQTTLTLSAPRSIWDQLINEKIPVRAVVDFSGLKAGKHEITIQPQVDIRPVQIKSVSPKNFTVILEPLANKDMTINLVRRGEPAVGFQVEPAILSQYHATISGPESLINRAHEVRAVLDVSQAQLAITRTVSLQAVDANEQVIDGLTITPNQITVTQYITQRGGYRNVVVKVMSAGQVENGYRLTNLSVYPPTVTIFSSDPKQVDEIPGYIETVPVDLNGVKDDQDLKVALNLPNGVSVVGEQTVQVQVGIAAIEGSITLSNMRIELVGLAEGIFGRVSPETVDVIISGPLPLLDGLKSRDVSVVVEMNGEDVGNYQRTPRVLLKSAELNVESILPGSVEVNVIGRVTVTPTALPRITPTPDSTPTSLP